MSSTYFDNLSKDYLNYYLSNYHNPKHVTTICDLSSHTSRICNLPELKLYKKLIIEKLKKPVLDESAISNKELYMKYINGGQVWSCGSGDYGLLGHGNYINKLIPTNIQYFTDYNIKIVNIAAGRDHSLFLDNVGRVYSCGWNEFMPFGQLGHTDKTPIPILIQYFVKNNIKIAYVTAGHYHSLFLDDNGKIYSCGRGDYGQLGHGYKDYKKEPTFIGYFTIRDIKIASMAAGETHSLFLDSLGQVYSCGNNESGRLGHGNENSKLEPTIINYFVEHNIKITHMSAGETHSLFLDDNGNIYSCGDSNFGKLGHIDLDIKLEPTLIQYFTTRDIKIVSMAAGETHSLFLDTIGRVYICGRGLGQYRIIANGRDNYELNDDDYIEPTLIIYFINHNIKIINIAAGNRHSLFLDNVGLVYSCGEGGFGQLGHGDYNRLSEPKLIENLPIVVDIKGGGDHSLYLV